MHQVGFASGVNPDKLLLFGQIENKISKLVVDFCCTS